MKINIKREPFQKVFQIAAAVAPARSPKTILQNVKIDVTKDEAVLTATDMEVGIRLVVPDVDVETLGSAVIPVSTQHRGMMRCSESTVVGQESIRCSRKMTALAAARKDCCYYTSW